MSLLHEIPSELLYEIFTHSSNDDSLAPLTLRQVCWSWKVIVDNSPRLWQTVELDDNHNDCFTTAQAKFWPQRAFPLQYDVHLNISDSTSILPLLAPLFPSLHRWRSISLGKKLTGHVPTTDMNLNLDKLSCLNIQLSEDDEEMDEEEQEEFPRLTITPAEENVEDVYSLNLWVPSLPPTPALPSLHFTHLYVSEGGIGGMHIRPKDLLQFLTACPRLQSVRLDGWPHIDPPDHDLPMVHLPDLTTLYLKYTCSVRPILSSIVVPRLQNLSLTFTNVAYQLETPYQDTGDSDDEAHDFSQSPWSDQATGMGLRKLIRTSNPPLKFLEMDYCDMRTKDFRWVFDHLDTLEEFRIVASEMSDRVISLLRPVLTPIGDGMALYSTRLRLPRLKSLALVNCQRLSGHAVVSALSKRVKYTDRFTPNATLSSVTVAECEGFGAWDRHLVAEVLGTRLKTAV